MLSIIKYSLIIFIVLVSIYFAIDYSKEKKLMDIKIINLENKRNISKRKIIFIFKTNKKIIYDNNQLINKIIISNKVNISMEKINSEEIISILREGAILKTSTDSIDIEENYVKLRGYMGIINKSSKKFYVNHEKKFSEMSDVGDSKCK